ncbi:NADH:flavin oxidoreductase/NADH oxidase family protein [uncultured Ferrimonas sp.]|uniref:NADH:flavin oxidoreductase/NADH oxidase family protein n=1 Tax=uncultured Ferrimonas sp. TaxID=432640 RepID=UPI00261A2854|nr:NADH:flavin oxidoreductase/NADH oxidase family protein [uncultured Ferrimonas sp.]
MTTVTLGSPLQQQRIHSINRVFKSAMSEQLGDKHHDPLPQQARLYQTWAKGEVGICVSGNVMIDRNALGEPGNVVLDQHSDLRKFKQWAVAADINGSKLWMQLNHPGKQIPAVLSPEPLAPSAISLGRGLEKSFNTPRAMTEAEIQATIAAFATAATLAKEAGFAGVQIHGAHGYLVSQFLSPRHNQRDDQWGGSADNRMRFVLAVFHAIRAAVGEDFPIGIKLNSADFMKDGFDETESMAVIKALDSAGIDLIEISGGTYESPSMMGAGKKTDVKASTAKREAYFLEYAEQARHQVNCTLVVTGGFRSAKAMNEALASGATDMIGLGRPLSLVPDLAKQAIHNDDFSVDVNNPTTGFKGLDAAAMLSITWYEAQLRRIGRGLEPKYNLSGWYAVFDTFTRLGKFAFAKRRG